MSAFGDLLRFKSAEQPAEQTPATTQKKKKILDRRDFDMIPSRMVNKMYTAINSAGSDFIVQFLTREPFDEVIELDETESMRRFIEMPEPDEDDVEEYEAYMSMKYHERVIYDEWKIHGYLVVSPYSNTYFGVFKKTTPVIGKSGKATSKMERVLESWVDNYSQIDDEYWREIPRGMGKSIQNMEIFNQFAEEITNKLSSGEYEKVDFNTYEEIVAFIFGKDSITTPTMGFMWDDFELSLFSGVGKGTVLTSFPPICKKGYTTFVSNVQKFRSLARSVAIIKLADKYPVVTTSSQDSMNLYHRALPNSSLVGIRLSPSCTEEELKKYACDYKISLLSYRGTNFIPIQRSGCELSTFLERLQANGHSLSVYRAEMYDKIIEMLMKNPDVRYYTLYCYCPTLISNLPDYDMAARCDYSPSNHLEWAMQKEYDDVIRGMLNYVFLAGYPLNQNVYGSVKAIRNMSEVKVKSILEKVSINTLKMVYIIANLYNEKVAVEFYRTLLEEDYLFFAPFNDDMLNKPTNRYKNNSEIAYSAFLNLFHVPREIPVDSRNSFDYLGYYTPHDLMYVDYKSVDAQNRSNAYYQMNEDGTMVSKFRIPSADKVIQVFLTGPREMGLNIGLVKAWDIIFHVWYNIIQRDGNRLIDGRTAVKIGSNRFYNFTEQFYVRNTKPATSDKLIRVLSSTVGSSKEELEAFFESFKYPMSYTELYNLFLLEISERYIVESDVELRLFRQATAPYKFLDNLELPYGMKTHLVTDYNDLAPMGRYFGNCLKNDRWIDICTNKGTALICIEPAELKNNGMHIFSMGSADVQSEVRPFCVSINTENGNINQYKTFQNKYRDSLTSKEIEMGKALQDMIYDLYEARGVNVSRGEYSYDMKGERHSTGYE